MSERWCSSRRHPVSGLFGRLAPASLPRFTATCGARPRLTVGSTLDGGPDWADGATRCQQGGGCLVACEVDGGVVITLVPGPALAAGPVPGPADVLLVQALVAGLRRRVPAAGLDEPGPVPAGLVPKLPPRLGQGRVGQATAACPGSVEPFLGEHPRCIQSFDHDGAVGLGESGGQVVDVVCADVRDPAVQPGEPVLGFAVAA